MPLHTEYGEFRPAIEYIYQAAIEVLEAILQGWPRFEKGIAARNYVGDIFGSLGGEPDLGPGRKPASESAIQSKDVDNIDPANAKLQK